MELFENDDIIESGIADYFPVGRKLSVQRLQDKNNENYPSYVKDIDSENIFIDIPTKGGVYIPLKVGSFINLSSITSEGLWSGESKIINTSFGNLAGVWVSCPTRLEKIQRREFIRIYCDITAKIYVMNLERTKPKDILDVVAYNISAGGIAVGHKYALPQTSSLRIQFRYFDQEFETAVKLIHVQYDASAKVYVTGLQILDLDTITTNKLHKKIIQKQIEMRRKGLI